MTKPVKLNPPRTFVIHALDATHVVDGVEIMAGRPFPTQNQQLVERCKTIVGLRVEEPVTETNPATEE